MTIKQVFLLFIVTIFVLFPPFTFAHNWFRKGKFPNQCLHTYAHTHTSTQKGIWTWRRRWRKQNKMMTCALFTRSTDAFSLSHSVCVWVCVYKFDIHPKIRDVISTNKKKKTKKVNFKVFANESWSGSDQNESQKCVTLLQKRLNCTSKISKKFWNEKYFHLPHTISLNYLF